MDPLNPMVPIRPATPTPPDYTRIRRIERDHERDADPDWQGAEEHTSEDPDQEPYEDGYEPDWQEPVEPTAYTADGVLQTPPDHRPRVRREPTRPWDSSRDADRRSGEHVPDPGVRPDGPDGPAHIDVSA